MTGEVVCSGITERHSHTHTHFLHYIVLLLGITTSEDTRLHSVPFREFLASFSASHAYHTEICHQSSLAPVTIFNLWGCNLDQGNCSAVVYTL